jgi:hypothetical protein
MNHDFRANERLLQQPFLRFSSEKVLRGVQPERAPQRDLLWLERQLRELRLIVLANILIPERLQLRDILLKPEHVGGDRTNGPDHSVVMMHLLL